MTREEVGITCYYNYAVFYVTLGIWKGGGTNVNREEDERLVVTIRWANMDDFWIWEPVTVSINLTMMNNIRVMDK